MIIGALLSFIFFIVSSLFLVLPRGTDIPLPDELSTAAQGIYSIASPWNYLFPVNEMFALLGVAMLFFGAYYALKIVLWSIHFVRGN